MYSIKTIKKALLLMLLMAVSMPWKVNAQETLTVYDGTDANQYIPMYGYYFDAYTKSECIIPATELTDMIGGAVSAITFYAKTVATTNSTWGTANQKVFLKEVSSTTLGGSYSGMTDATIVFDGLLEMPTTSSGGYTITFSEDYTYNGGNLLIGVYNDNKGKYNKVEWYGIGNQTSGVSAYGNNSNSLENASYNAQPFLPKTTFTYTPAAVGGCAKPKNFTATSITAHSATLTWTAGGEESSWDVYVTTTATDVPDENTTPTYQVTECSKALTNLTAQTIYYAYVRANCGDGDKSKWASKTFTTTREALAVDANNPYSQDFETNNDWELINGALVNIWYWGSATNNGGEKSMYVSKDDGESNTYNVSNTAVVYVSKLFTFEQGTYTFVFDWKANGESNYDYLRVALIPGDMEFTAGTNLPSGVNTTSLPDTWIALDGGSKLNLKENWQSQTAEANVSGTYTMVFIWRNDSGGGNQPPAAIDNISISYMTCPRPTNLTASDITGRTATLTWTENGTATNWVLQYATNNSFTENLVETNVSSATTINLSGLTPETPYYARVKSILGNEESSWSDVCNFTTTATCEKPTLSYVTNSNTAHSGAVSWTGNADNYELIYSTKTSFEPGEEGVIQIDLGNVNTYTLQDLTPETTYRIKVRANCGADDGYSQWSNQVSFTTTATCVAPSGLSATATSSTITLNWTAGAQGQDAWDIRYKTGTNEYTYIHLDNQTTTSYTITGLNPVTTYSVNVRAYCSEEDQSKWGYSSYNQNSDLSITTECAALTLPYTCDFEGALETSQSSSYPMPKCWTRKEYRGGYQGSYTYYPSVREASYSYPYAHGGNGESATSGKSVHFYKPYTSTDEAAILPEVDGQYTMANLQISFWARLESYMTNKDLSIGIMTDPSDINTFTEVATITVLNETFQQYTAFFDSYAGNGRYIAIRFNSNTSGYIFVDDVTVEEIPSCRIPKDLEVAEIDVDEATLNWTAGLDETAWNVQYKRASDNEWSDPIAVDETSYTFTGLQRATAYEARVQAVCSAEDQSDWTEVSFTTECGIWPIDAQNGLFEDFEKDDLPICWDKFSHEMSGYSYWYLNSNNGLGSSAAFSYWNEGYAFLVMPQMHINGNATLSFDYLIGSGSYNENCSVVVSTGAMTYDDFTTTIWEGDGPTSGKASATVSLSAFDNDDIYIAFKYKGTECTWYVDNVQVFVADKIFTTDGNWNEAGNWQPEGVPTNTESVRINATATVPSGCTAEANNITVGTGSLTIADGGQLRHNNAGVQATIQKIINGYTSDKDNYYLIASPMAENTAVSSSTNLTSNDYDLYSFDQSQELEWRNHKDGAFSNLNNTVGYLYANSQTMTSNLYGELMPSNEGVEVTLAYDENAQFAGWNLIGNPFACNAYTEDDLNFYKIDGTELVASNESVAPMEGIFVEATAENQSVTFQRTPFGISGKGILNLNASRSGNRVDLVRIRFSEGRNLGKLMLHRNASKLYIPQDGRDYAVVHSEGIGEMPVNFKAAENGTYTLNVNTEDVEMNYLHLIDNLTGADVNLLQTPSYSFEAKTTDYESRFKLVFSTKATEPVGSDQPFAFISNGNIIIDGEGVLQVIDVTGRIIVNRDGVHTVSTNGMTPGVYVLHLINGNDVKTQKIIIK